MGRSATQEQQLFEALRANQFVDELRFLKIDEAAFLELEKLLEQLKVVWQTEMSVDKLLAQELLVILTITKSMAESMRSHNYQYQDRARDLAAEVERLVLECFGVG